MHDHQLMFLIKLWAGGCRIQTVLINESGNMNVSFFDKGGNFHEQSLSGGGKLRTIE